MAGPGACGADGAWGRLVRVTFGKALQVAGEVDLGLGVLVLEEAVHW